MVYRIAIDGPASSGKSTIAKQLAQRLGIIYIDTGAMYRAVTLEIIRQEIDIKNDFQLKACLRELDLTLKIIDDVQHVFINGEDESETIRSVEVTRKVSEIAAMPIVRKYLVAKQQKLAEKESVIMDGRDIGTVVLPTAEYKFYLIASPDVRALRRYNENMEKGLINQSLDEIREELIERDNYDMNRKTSPLKQADDAVLIDTSEMSIEEVVKKIESYLYLNELNCK